MLKAFAIGSWIAAILVMYQNGWEFFGGWVVLLVATNLTTAIVLKEKS